MTINMEVKKDGLQQLQSGSWKLTLTVNAEDMSMEIMQAPMGTPYGLAMVPIQYDDTPPNLDHFTSYKENSNATTKVAEKTEGDKLRERACILCKEKDFQTYVNQIGAYGYNEAGARLFIYVECEIESRKTLVTCEAAQVLFKNMDRQYKEWLNPIEDQYKDNLEQF